MLNKVGDNESPWRTPLLTSNQFVLNCFNFTQETVFLYNWSISLNIFPFIPILNNLYFSKSLSIQANAYLKMRHKRVFQLSFRYVL